MPSRKVGMLGLLKQNPIRLTLDRVFYLWSLICRY
nr:MAG TPA: hypothetical protein [Caudoviricetes sp.]